MAQRRERGKRREGSDWAKNIPKPNESSIESKNELSATAPSLLVLRMRHAELNTRGHGNIQGQVKAVPYVAGPAGSIQAIFAGASVSISSDSMTGTGGGARRPARLRVAAGVEAADSGR